MTRSDRIHGSLLGLAWGDVFGCPVESLRAADIRSAFGHYDRLPDAYPLDRMTALGSKVIGRLRPLGLYSDDTQQALALLNVALATQWSPTTWAEWLTNGMQHNVWRGFGRNFVGSVSRLRKGTPPQRSGVTTPGIGAAMRTGPLGALFHDRPQQLVQVVMESSCVTHGDIRAASFAYAIAAAVARLVQGQLVEAVRAELPGDVAAVEKEWLTGHADWTIDRSAGPLVSQVLAEFFATPTSSESLCQRICDLAGPHVPEAPEIHANAGFALLGGLHALAVGLGPVDDPNAALAAMIREGFDTDTVAAIAGSLFGARFGTAWIPRDRLLDLPRLETYAAAVADRTGPPETLTEFLRREGDWTRREADFQRGLLKG